MGGGYGAGTYFPWVYVQIALLLPLARWIYRKLKKTQVLIIMLFLCEALEILCSIINVPDSIYRLLAVRYLFLIFLGWLWAIEGVQINIKTVTIALISLSVLLIFEYANRGFEPWFFNTGWTTHRWPCYFWISYGLVPVLYVIWGKITKNTTITNVVKMLAASSYEIFLIQLSLIALLRYKDVQFIISNNALSYVVWVLIVWSVSIGGGIMLHTIMNTNKLKEKKRMV